MSRTHRVGMVVPSLNTIGEDDLRLFCPPEVRFHVHRIRLRHEPGRVTRDNLARAHQEAVAESRFLKDMGPDAIVFNCTGASVACGPTGDATLAERMSHELALPCTNTMVAIKRALAAVGAKRLLHVCPFADEFSGEEREALEASGFEVVKSVGLNFTDAREAARMDPQRIVEIANGHAQALDIDGVLLSCANVRAFEAVQALERSLGLPVITSNQAVLWDLLRLIGWRGDVPSGGRLFQA